MRRREFLTTGGALAGGLLARAAPVRCQTGEALSVVETSSGRIWGRLRNGTHVFQGIPYAAAPVGSRRFMPPVPPEPWTGVREMLAYGARAYQPFRPMIPEIGDALTGTGPMSEDCLRLNVWTPVTGQGNRPVMVWLHGGGFRTGSGNSIFYDGEALARNHDVVVVTITHRLNAFGFLYLSELGDERLSRSANLGMQDIVMALEWVRDNIGVFGGSASNVTVFGQSGGGGKTSILHGMPSARGLFHRAIIMSTLADTAVTALRPAEAIESAERLLARLGRQATELEALQQLPAQTLIEVMTGGANRARGEDTSDLSLRFTPVVDGRVLVRDPFAPDASELAADVPILCGSNETEVVPYGNPDATFWTREPSTRTELRAYVRDRYRLADSEADVLIDLYRRNRPNDSFGDLALCMDSDNSPLRLSAYTIAERKVAQAAAPTYMYYFRWRSPVRGGKLHAMHGMEIPFVFDHVDDLQMLTGTGRDRYGLAQQMSAAWVAFARSGNPNHERLPAWPAFTVSDRATMVFDAETRLVNDPYGEERRAMAALRARNRPEA
jgi:para-nitrobenzyl esterase